MAERKLDLSNLLKDLARRTPGRTEATLQAQLHTFLLAAPLDLDDSDLDVRLEQPAGSGTRHRIDVEAGNCVFEVKKDLRKARVRDDAIKQLAGYVRERSDVTGQRYVGVLTDGAEWLLYRVHEEELQVVSSLEVSWEKPNVEGLCIWLEGVLATTEQLKPTPIEIERLLGARSPSHLLDIADIAELYATHRNESGIQLKRELWAKLLKTALGTAFRNDDKLFAQHTLLVVMAEVIAHAVLNIDPRDMNPIALVTGQRFRQARVLGVVESDFFDWVAEVPGGEKLVRSLSRRLARFAWADVEHDVLKVLYESIIPAQQRKQLGEYYTPDWLAEHMVEETVTEPLKNRVLDPSCGSGTFLFHAVRRVLAASEAAGFTNRDALDRVCSLVMGMDLHPVAVTLARVTYLLAIGAGRLRSDRGPISVPVFLGDSLQWGQEETLQTQGALVIQAEEGLQLFARQLRFPDSVLDNAGTFDGLVAELAELATKRKIGSAVPPLAHVHRRYAVAKQDQEVLDETFRVMCSLNDQGRNHIWGYYVRNLARPRWLAREPNRVDVLIGNPPWLSYRYMTAEMQAEFRKLLKERQLWSNAKSATSVDLSSVFVVRSIERYLKVDGRFAFVMPFAVLSRQQFARFRTGEWPRPQGFPVRADLEPAWDFHSVRPPFFEVPCCVIRGRRVRDDAPRATQTRAVVAWSGRAPAKNLTWAKARESLKSSSSSVVEAGAEAHKSPYGARFAQGATLVPRVLCFVDELVAGPLGQAQGEARVRSHRSAAEKKPWKDLPALEGVLESNFVMPVYMGDTILPFRIREPAHAVIPWDGQRLLHGRDAHLAKYPGLQEWWTRAEALWREHRKSDSLELIDRLDYQRTLRSQFLMGGLAPAVRVVYSASGMYVAAAVIEDPNAVIEHQLYWAACSSRDEAHFLATILNSERVTRGVRKYQARGEHNPRHFDMYIWQLAVPAFNATDATHLELADLGRQAVAFAAALTLPVTRFEKQRRFIREAIAGSALGRKIEQRVGTLGV